MGESLLEPREATRLVALERARVLVAEARTLDEAKDLADQAEALRILARKKGLSLEIQNDCAEITLRATRRIGELTRELPTNQGARADLTSYHDDTKLQPKVAALAAAGLSKLDASRGEQIAAIPDEVFEAHLTTTKARGRELTQAATLEVAREYRAPILARTPIEAPHLDDDSALLIVGDARNLPLADESVDLIVTSPPYGLGKEYGGDDDAVGSWIVFMQKWLGDAWRVTKDGGRLALNVPLDTTRGGCRPTYALAVEAAYMGGWNYRSTIVWHEGNITHSTGRGSVDSPSSPHIMAPVEMIALFSKGDWNQHRTAASDLTHPEWLDWTNGLWTFPGESRPWEGHPAPFPLELPHRLMKLLSFPGDLVLDPFVGSGSAALAAVALGRRVIGIDQSAAYVASAQRRLAAFLQSRDRSVGYAMTRPLPDGSIASQSPLF